jgi:hypothetical protein
MTSADVVAGLDLLLIDGDNLLHDVRGSRDEGGVAWLLPRLVAWRPDHLRIVVALDGHPAPGETARQRVTRGIEFLHSGSRSADDLLLELLADQPYAGRSRTAVVTRDRGLRTRVNRAGGLTRSLDWLTGELAGPGARGRSDQGQVRPVGIGQGKPPRPGPVDSPAIEGEEGDAWTPGRGATKKRGNPRRRPKRGRRR